MNRDGEPTFVMSHDQATGAAKKRETDRAFLLGVLWSAWWLHKSHGEDTYAEDLLLETAGSRGIAEMRRLAYREEYHFKRGFWAETIRKAMR